MTQTFRDIHKPYILCTCKILGIIPKFKNRQFIVPLKSFLYNSAISISNYTNRYLWTFFYYSKSTHNKSDSSKGLSRTFFSSATKPFVWNHNNIKARFKSTLAHSVRAFRSHISLRFEPGKKVKYDEDPQNWIKRRFVMYYNIIIYIRRGNAPGKVSRSDIAKVV